MKNRLPTHLLMSFALLLVAFGAFAQQTVTPTPTPQTVAPSTPFSFDVVYTGATATTALGLRMHFNSSQVTFNNVTNVFAAPIRTIAGAPQDDTVSDFDGDPSTDKFFLVAWTDPGAAWPGSSPVTLYTANYTTAAGFTGTTIRFTRSSGPGTFTGNPEVINAPVPPTITLTPDPLAVAAGTSANMTVTIDTVQTTNTTVTLASSTGAATVPASVVIPANQASATFAVTGVTSGGSAVITATLPVGLGGDTDTATVNVTAATITLTPATANVANGGTVQMTVQIAPAQIATVALSTAGGHTSVPATVNTNAAGTATFNVTGTSVGGPDTITATLPIALGGGSDTSQVTVQAVTLTLSPATTATAVVGAPITYTACINPAPVAATVVTIPVDPDFTFSATSVTIPAGSTCAPTFTARPNAVTAAPTTFSVTAPGGLTGTATVSAVTAITCTLTNSGNGVLLTISQAQPVGFPVTVTSSDPTVLTVSTPFNFPANQTSATIPYTVLTAGTSTVSTTLDATVGGALCRVNATVNPIPVPAVDGLGLALLAGLLALAGLYFVRK